MSNARSLLYELVNVLVTRQKIKRERPQDSLIVPNCCKHFKLELQTSGVKFTTIMIKNMYVSKFQSLV